jgi:hypothetical protein
MECKGFLNVFPSEGERKEEKDGEWVMNPFPVESGFA